MAFDAIMHRYSIGDPMLIERRWSWARVYVLTEAAAHNSYSPPHDEGGPAGHQGGPRNVIDGNDMIALGLIRFQEVP